MIISIPQSYDKMIFKEVKSEIQAFIINFRSNNIMKLYLVDNVYIISFKNETRIQSKVSAWKDFIVQVFSFSLSHRARASVKCCG